MNLMMLEELRRQGHSWQNLSQHGGITLSKIVKIKILKPHAHLHIIGRKTTKFQVNPMEDVGGVAETRYLGWTDGRTDGITHTDG